MNIVCDHGVFATHDTCDTDSLPAIADHQNLIVHLTFLTIQCYEFLSCFRTTHNDFSAFDGIQIICVHRLAVFFHNIVCNVYKVVDRTDAVRSEASLHPFR